GVPGLDRRPGHDRGGHVRRRRASCADLPQPEPGGGRAPGGRRGRARPGDTTQRDARRGPVPPGEAAPAGDRGPARWNRTSACITLRRIPWACAGYCPIRASIDVACGLRPAVTHYRPTGVHTAGTCLISEPGRVENISVPASVTGSDRVFFLKITAEPGDVIRRPP